MRDKFLDKLLGKQALSCYLRTCYKTIYSLQKNQNVKEKITDLVMSNNIELNVEELKLIINNDNVFSLSKKDKKVLEKIIENNSLISNTNKIVSTLQEGLPSLFEVLNNLIKNYRIKF